MHGALRNVIRIEFHVRQHNVGWAIRTGVFAMRYSLAVILTTVDFAQLLDPVTALAEVASLKNVCL